MKHPPVIAALIVAASVASADAPRLSRADRIVAVVDDNIILESELEIQIKAQDVEPQQLETARQQILREMIETTLIVAEAHRRRIRVSQSDVDRAISEVKVRNGISDEKLQLSLARQGYTLETYRDTVHKQLIELKAVSLVLRPHIHVSERDARLHYENLRKEVGGTADSLPFARVQGEIEQQLYRERLQLAQRKWVEELRDAAIIRVRL